MNTCEKFARAMAKTKGMTYKEAVEKYPRGYEAKSVYVDGSKIHTAHCVHCARAEVLSDEED